MERVGDYVEQPVGVASEVNLVAFSELGSLHKLFVRSVDDGFDYFNDSFKKKLLQQHNLPRLMKAHFSPRASLFVLRDASSVSRLAGYCFVRQDGPIAYLYWMYVAPELRGLGLGGQLLQTALGEARRRQVDSLQLVTHDKELFYRQAGFRSIRHVAGLLGGVDMAIMEYRF